MWLLLYGIKIFRLQARPKKGISVSKKKGNANRPTSLQGAKKNKNFRLLFRRNLIIMKSYALVCLLGLLSTLVFARKGKNVAHLHHHFFQPIQPSDSQRIFTFRHIAGPRFLSNENNAVLQHHAHRDLLQQQTHPIANSGGISSSMLGASGGGAGGNFGTMGSDTPHGSSTSDIGSSQSGVTHSEADGTFAMGSGRSDASSTSSEQQPQSSNNADDNHPQHEKEVHHGEEDDHGNENKKFVVVVNKEPKKVVVIVPPPKPIEEIPVCSPAIAEACCETKDYCPWNSYDFPLNMYPKKTCTVKVKVCFLSNCFFPCFLFYSSKSYV